MLRRCLRRPLTTHHAIASPARRTVGLRFQRNASSTPKPSTTTPKEPISSKAIRYVAKPWAAPPVLARFPLARQAVRSLIFLLASCLGLHIFFEYFYTLEGAYGISMLPTIASSGDSLLISKYYRRGRELHVGDIVSYKHPVDHGVFAVKRIVGMPGDFVLSGTPGEGGGRMIQVPQGHCWIVGDNLSWSRDSRMFGPLPLALVTGKVVAKWTTWFPRRLDGGLRNAVVEEDDVD